jgi:L-threonylcarbamoyladenylate synthase
MNIRIEAPSDHAIECAVEHLKSGGLVGLPTETVYGLAASTLDADAIDSIFRVKGRPSDNPLIAHVWGPDDAKVIVDGWDERCDLLASAFWPGPLTMVLHRSSSVPSGASGGRSTLAVRSPEHPVARRLLQAFSGPVSAPSANRSGGISPTSADHVAAEFEEVDSDGTLLIIDGGPCALGIESTVIDLTSPVPRVLRPGSITNEMIQEVIGEVDGSRIESQSASPGTGSRHYAPSTPLKLIRSDQLHEHTATTSVVIGTSSILDGASGPRIGLPSDPDGYAEGLYDALRRADSMNHDSILVVLPGDGPEWRAVLDRLERASQAAP